MQTRTLHRLHNEILCLISASLETKHWDPFDHVKMFIEHVSNTNIVRECGICVVFQNIVNSSVYTLILSKMCAFHTALDQCTPCLNLGATYYAFLSVIKEILPLQTLQSKAKFLDCGVVKKRNVKRRLNGWRTVYAKRMFQTFRVLWMIRYEHFTFMCFL